MCLLFLRRAQGQITGIADGLTDGIFVGVGLGPDRHLLGAQVCLGQGVRHGVQGVLHMALAVLAGHAVHTHDQTVQVMAFVGVGGLDLPSGGVMLTAAAAAMVQVISGLQ